MKTLLTAIFNFMSSVNPLFTCIALVGVSVVSFFNWINTEWTAMLTKLDAVVQPTFAGTLSISPLGFLDTFIPLHETLTFFTIWLGILATAGAVRIVKSFVPTVAS